MENASAQTTLPSGVIYDYTTNTSGWFGYNLLDPGTYHVLAAPPSTGWWTPIGAEECEAVLVNNWEEIPCHIG